MPPAEEGRVRRREETLRRHYNRHAGLPGGDRTDHPGGAGHVSTAQALQVPVTVLFSLCVDGALAGSSGISRFALTVSSPSLPR